MRVLAACEESQEVARAFRALGHDAWSADLLPSAHCDAACPPSGACDLHGHHRGDVAPLLVPGAWDLLIAFPPCTYLCRAGLHWNVRRPGRAALTEEALAFVRSLMDAPVEKIAIENPNGRIGTAIRKADQIIHPYLFGHDASKLTGLWLKNLPQLRPTQMVEPRWVERGVMRGRKPYGGPLPRWGNQTDSGQNRLSPSADRAKIRSRTYPGIARAMAEQWGGLE